MVNVFEVRKFVLWSGLLVAALALVAVAALSSHKLTAAFLLAIMPFAIFAVLTLLEANDLQAKRQMRQRSVLRVSRSVYERLDPEVLQLFLSERDFTSTDYERLMQLEAFNEKKSEGATDADIRRLPLASITEPMLRAAKNPSCSICLVQFELQEQVRLMPCFHHFHPTCIDPWLKEKALCPVCKCPIIG